MRGLWGGCDVGGEGFGCLLRDSFERAFRRGLFEVEGGGVVDVVDEMEDEAEEVEEKMLRRLVVLSMEL